MRVKLVLAALFLAASFPVFSQAVPSATEGGLQLAVGAGFSASEGDLGVGRMEGGTLWVDWSPNKVPSYLSGLGLEMEARDLGIAHSSTLPSNFRQASAGGGAIYTWRPYHNFRTYSKFLVEFGKIAHAGSPTNIDGTSIVYVPGGGLEYRAFRNIWVRADFETQLWPQVYKTAYALMGGTVGASYDFRHIHAHY